MEATVKGIRRLFDPVRKGKRKWLLIGLAVLVLGAGFLAYQAWREPQQAAAFARVIPVQRGDVTETVTASGTVQASERVAITLSASGKAIMAIHVKVGDRVKAGQVLATLDDAEAQIQLKEAEANLMSARAKLAEAKQPKSAHELKTLEANVSQAKAALEAAEKGYASQKVQYDLERAKTNLERAKQTFQAQSALYEAGAISKSEWEEAKISLNLAQNEYDAAVLQHTQTQAQAASDVEQARAAYETAVAELREAQAGPDESTVAAAEAAVIQAEAQLLKARQAVEELTVKAPMDGVVVQVNGTVGQPPEDPFIVIDNSDSGQLEVLAQVSETDIGKVKEGLSATFTTSSYPDKTFAGKVTLVYPEPTVQSGVTTYQVLLSVDNPEGLLRTGMSLNVTIEIGTHRNVLYVPAAALRSQNGQDGVLLASGGGAREAGGEEAGPAVRNGGAGMPYRFQPVTIGYYSTDKVEITSGLKEGDQVVVIASAPTAGANSGPPMMRPPGTGGMGGPGGGGFVGPRGNR